MRHNHLSDLEYDKILEIISSFCFTEEGKNRVISTQPLSYGRKYTEALTLISHKQSLIIKIKNIHKGIVIPVINNELVKIWRTSSKQGVIIQPKQLYEIYEFLKTFKELIVFITNLDNEYLILKELITIDVNDFYEKFEDLERKVKKSIDQNGNIFRTASDRLDKIISEKERIETSAIRILNDFINKPENEEFLQDRFVTIRNNRFVIPIKIDYINAIDGFVQDISSTGHTAFVEPKFIQPYAIRYLELVDEERREVDRILQEITSKLGNLSGLIDDIINIISEFDELQAVARFSIITNSEKVILSSKQIVKLINARHPLLKNPVPISVEIGENEFGGIIISGPNTSGKTVSIKTIGLLTAMALSGFPIPADPNSVIGYFDNILADIGDPQSIEKNLSTFSAHIIKLKDIIEIADAKSLVILDEIGTGTDPREGEALAVAVLKYLAKKKSKIAVATHYSLVKKLPMSNSYFRNAYMDFDNETLKPLYKLVIGMPGSSNAILIAHKLGLNDEITSDALKVMTEGVDIHEKFIIEIQNEKREIEKIKEELKEKIEEIEKIKKDYKQKMKELEQKLEKVRRREFDGILSDIYELKSKITKIRQRLVSESISQKELEEINKELLNTTSEIDLKPALEDFVRVENPKVGEKVFSNRFGQTGVISKILGDGKVEILAGKMRLITTTEDLFLVNSDNV
ncbi:MAG: hypothetical protein RMJ37_07155 [Spirochaetia bacterium]|nr:hypothetical protein [Spirochaetota bacterium]MDW8113093.1 hypothetical protein [Spirochaetia bacterium]